MGSVMPRVTCCGLYSFFFLYGSKNVHQVPKHVGVLILVMKCLLKCICWWICWLHEYAKYE